jgi:flagellar biosynthetic protein FlhB
MADQNKTEQATPHRRQEARKKGQIARSRELSSALALAGTGLVLFWQGRELAPRFSGFLRSSLSVATTEPVTTTTPLLWWSSAEVLRGIVPSLSAALLLAVTAGAMQGGMVFAGESLQPKFERLSPAKKLQQMFSLTGLSGLLKSLLPFAAIVVIGVSVLQKHWSAFVLASYLNLHAFASLVLAAILEVGWKSALVLLAWAGIDYFLAWRKLEGDLRMTRQELRDDYKETEGSPETKARIRKIQRSLRRQQLLRATETATVVVTNPTHYAVALRYELDMEAPIVVSKGRDLLAQTIKDVARWHDIPIMENKPLAQALYRSVKVGQQIPAKLYTAVAEILVLVFQAQAQVRRQRARHTQARPESERGERP